MRRIIIPVATGLAMIASAGVSVAQEQGRQGHGQAPAGGGGMRGPPAGGASGPRIGPAERQGPRAASPGRVEQNRRAEPQRVNRERQQATERQQHRNVQEERSRVERQRSTSRNAERAQEQRRVEEQQRRSAQTPGGRDRQATERNAGGDQLIRRREEMREARTHLGPEDRQRLHAGFDVGRARLINAKFDWHVGHRVPRNVHLYPVPREVISFFPYYRDYSYFAVGEDICIVDSRTYEVVDVIDEGYYRGAPRPAIARLSLSGSQIALIRDSLPPDFPDSGLRLRLALGAEIPRDVELHEFPPLVLDRVPALADYRFVLAQDQIVIVDQRDRAIALVIDRA
jgi:Protein of unknown function (DUF1236)